VFQSSYQGNHSLISRGGAKLVTSAKEILEDIPKHYLQHSKPMGEINARSALPHFSNSFERDIYCILQDAPASLDALCHQMDLPVSTVQETCTMMEIKGQIQSKGHGYWEVKRGSL